MPAKPKTLLSAIRVFVTLCDIVLSVCCIGIFIQEAKRVSDVPLLFLFLLSCGILSPLNIILIWYAPSEAISYLALRYKRKCLEESKRIESLKSELSIKK